MGVCPSWVGWKDLGEVSSVLVPRRPRSRSPSRGKDTETVRALYKEAHLSFFRGPQGRLHSTSYEPFVNSKRACTSITCASTSTRKILVRTYVVFVQVRSTRKTANGTAGAGRALSLVPSCSGSCNR